MTNPALAAEWDRMHAACKTHHTSEPMQIGKHQWRMVIKDFVLGFKVRPYTEYQWMDKAGQLRPGKDWPSYDGDDTYSGLPRTLNKLYEREKIHVDRIIYGREPGAAPQMELTL